MSDTVRFAVQTLLAATGAWMVVSIVRAVLC